MNIEKITDEYQELEANEKEHRRNIDIDRSRLQRSWLLSMRKNIYGLLYKQEYGDYRDFVDAISKELRDRAKMNQK